MTRIHIGRLFIKFALAVFFFALLIVGTTKVFAQGQYDFDILTMDDGLSSSSANAIIQDKKGFMWIGTWNGLNRYDGNEIITYQPVFRDSSSLLNREIRALCEDVDGNIWIGTSLGLSKLNPVTNNFTHYDFNYLVVKIYQDRYQNIWIGTERDGLFLFDQEENTFEHYLSDEQVYCILEDSRNEFWIGTNRGLFNINRQSKRYQRYLRDLDPRQQNSDSYPAVEDIVEAQDGSLWVACGGLGVYRLRFPVDKDNLEIMDFSPINGVGNKYQLAANQLEIDKKGNLWIGTWGNGVYTYSKQEIEGNKHPRFANNYRSSLTNPFSLGGDDFIKGIYADNHGQIWIASSVISITNVNANGIMRYNTQSYNGNSIVNKWVSSIDSKKNGDLWVGTLDGILNYTFENGAYSLDRFIKRDDLVSSNQTKPDGVMAILFDSNENTWLGTLNAGILFHKKRQDDRYNKNTVLVLNANTSPSIGANSVTQVVESKLKHNAVWLATARGLVFCYYENNSLKTERIYQLDERNKLSHPIVRAIAEDKSGLVWIGTQNGLDCYNPVTGTIQNFQYSQTDLSSINNNIINALYVDSDNQVWVGTNSGVNKVILDRSVPNPEISFKSYNQSRYLNSEIILNIVEDEHKNMWFGVYNGIVKFNKNKEELIDEYFVKEYQRVSIDRLSSCKQIDGSFLFGGGNGFLCFHPDEFAVSDDEPEVQLTNLLVFNKPVAIGDSINNQVILNKSITYSDTLFLSYKQRIFSLYFSVMDFSAPGECEFEYMLEGFDDDWNLLQSSNSATYTDIPPGEYKFWVRGSNSNGLWSKEPRKLTVIITPPWWRTTYSYVSLLIVVLILLFFIERRYILKIKDKNSLLVERVKLEKEHELSDLKLHFFTNITHELRTPLTLILGPVEEMIEEKADLGKYTGSIKLIEKNAKRLLRLINQLMEFRKVENNKMDLQLKYVDINPILTDIYEVFSGMAGTRNIEFSLNLKEKNLWAEIDKDKFDKILFNLLSNAFKFTEDGGEVKIISGLTNNKDHFFIEVNDTGIGIPSEYQERIFERFYQVNEKNTSSTGGIGLYLTQAFVELHQGMINVVSEPGSGTSFRVEIPVRVTESHHLGNLNDQVDDPELSEEELNVDAENENDIENVEDKKPYLIVAEDDLELNEFLVSSLSSDYRVKSTFNGKDALEFARRSEPDLIISDVMMPEMDGFELAETLKNDINTSHIPVLFLTAKTTLQNEIEGLKSGAVDYIYKPFSIVSLKLKVKNILSSREQLRDRYRKNDILEPQKITLTSLDEKFLKDAVAAVDEMIDNPALDVETLSKKIGLSPNQTYRKIKALTGQTAKEFIRTQRLKTAADLLKQNKRNVSEIIYMVGFSSPSYFSRCFRDFYGCTPTEFIDQQQEK